LKRVIVSLLAAASVFCASLSGPAFAGTLAGYRLLVLGGQTLKWGLPSFGSGAIVTYALAREERTFDGARNCGAIRPIDGLLADNHVGKALFERELADAFNAWEKVANIKFRPGNPADADIVIGAQRDPIGRAFTNVAFDTPVTKNGVDNISGAVICLNPEQHWKVGFDGNLAVYDLRYTLMHEIGHAIGLNHPGPEGGIMGFVYNEAFATPQAGDIKGVVSLYGVPKQTVEAKVITKSPPRRAGAYRGEAALPAPVPMPEP